MSYLHVATTALTMGIACLAIGFAFIGLRPVRSNRSAGSYWSVAAICQGSAWLLIGMRSQLPEIVPILLANALIAANAILLLHGAQSYGGKEKCVSVGAWSGLLLLVTALYGALAYYTDDLHPRIVLTSLIRVPLLFLAIVSIWRYAPRHGRRQLTVLFSIDIGWHVIRAAASMLSEDPGSDFLQTDIIQAGTLLLRGACIILIIAVQFRVESEATRITLQEWTAELEVESAQLEMTIAQRNKELLERASTDFLTGIPNRRAFMAHAGKEIGRARHNRQPLSLLMIDIDHFKSINDRFGHPTGDRAIIAMAHHCVKACRTTDLAGRIGGEEFAILLPETDTEQAMVFAQRLHAGTRELGVLHEGLGVSLNISIGIATLAEGDPDFEALMLRADQALYQAKSAGRDCVRCA